MANCERHHEHQVRLQIRDEEPRHSRAATMSSPPSIKRRVFLIWGFSPTTTSRRAAELVVAVVVCWQAPYRFQETHACSCMGQCEQQTLCDSEFTSSMAMKWLPLVPRASTSKRAHLQATHTHKQQVVGHELNPSERSLEMTHLSSFASQQTNRAPHSAVRPSSQMNNCLFVRVCAIG